MLLCLALTELKQHHTAQHCSCVVRLTSVWSVALVLADDRSHGRSPKGKDEQEQGSCAMSCGYTVLVVVLPMLRLMNHLFQQANDGEK